MNRSDADIITRARADMTEFVRPIERDLDRAERGFQQFGKTVNTSMVTVSTSTTKAAKDVQRELAGLANSQRTLADSANRSRAAYQQLGFQLSDVVAQASNGTSAFVILAQQGGQTAAALSGLGGAAGRVAGFLAGPFGAAVFGAVTLFGLLASRTDEAAKKQAEAVDQFDAARLASLDLGTALKELNQLTGANVLSVEEQIRALIAVTQAKREDALATREQIRAQIALQEQQLKAARDALRNPGGSAGVAGGGGGLGAVLAARQEAGDLSALQAARERNELEIAQAAQAIAAAEKRLQAIRTEAAKKGAAEREKIEREAQREAQAELREGEKRRQTALQAELALVEAQGQAMRDLAEIYARLEGGFGSRFDQGIAGLRSRFPSGSSVFDAGGSAELKGIVDRELAEAGLGARTVAREFRQEGIVAAQAIAQAFGGQVGGQVNRIAGTLRGLSTGDFTSVGGPVGGAATIIARDPSTRRALEQTFEPVTREVSKLADDLGKKFGLEGGGQILGSAVAGFGIGSALGGNTESSVGGAIGSVAGSAIGTAIGGPIGGAIGSVLGGIVGSGIGGLFAGPKKGSATITASGGEFSVGAATGNSASRRAAASSIGGSVADSLNRIASTLGADIGSFAVSVGQRDGVFSVDPTGRGNVSKRFGVQQFSSAEEAARFAIRDAINDGALTGISQTVINAIRNASTLERGLDEAVRIQSIGRRLRELEDPIGSAFEELRKQFDGLRDSLKDAGGTVEELAELERLYSREREQLATQSVATLQGFLSSLQVGGNSPLSLSDQRRNAELAFSKFETDIRAGRTIDQSAFVAAGQNLLDVDRQIFGGTQGFFDTFRRVEGLTGQAISGMQNATAIREAELAAAAKSTADSTAATVNILNQIQLQLERMASLPGGGGFVGADAAGRGFVRAA